MAWQDQHPAPSADDSGEAVVLVAGAWLAAIVIGVALLWLATRGW